MQFSQILKNLMEKNKLTSYRIGKDTGISIRLIDYWKSGKRTPGAENLKRLAEYFNVSTDYLLGESTFGSRMKKKRLSADISIQTLSKITGIKESTLEKYESEERREIKMGQLKKIANALATTIEELAYFNFPPELIDNDDVTIQFNLDGRVATTERFVIGEGVPISKQPAPALDSVAEKKMQSNNASINFSDGDYKNYISTFLSLLSNIQDAEKLSEADIGAALYAALLDGTIIVNEQSHNVQRIKNIYNCFKMLLDIPPELRKKILNFDIEDNLKD